MAVKRACTHPDCTEEGILTLKGKCRFCGLSRADFKVQNRPDCDWKATGVTKPKMSPASNG